MSLLVDEFSLASERIKSIHTKPSNSELLELYGLYKQATLGDCNTAQPWGVQIEARAKWNAWNANKGQSRDIAMGKYINLVNELMK